MPKEMTITFQNIPDDWTGEDIKHAVVMGIFIKTLRKNPSILKKIAANAKRFPDE